MKTYKAIIYDIDGTLLDTLKMNMIPLQTIIEEETGVKLPYQEVLKYVSYPGMKVLEELNIKNPALVYERWVNYVNHYHEGATPYEGVETLLSSLHLKYKQAVVSAKTREQYQIDFTMFMDYFEISVLLEDTLEHKPHPEPINKCIALLGLDKSECLYVGDAYSDYVAAKAANVDFAYATWGSVNQEGIDDATFIVNQPLDLLKLLHL